MRSRDPRCGDRSRPQRSPYTRDRAATGPDLKKIFIGAHHKYGEIQEATLQIIPKPEIRKVVKIKSDRNLIRKIWEAGIRPLTIRNHAGWVHVELEGLLDIVNAEEKVLKSFKKGRGDTL